MSELSDEAIETLQGQAYEVGKIAGIEEMVRRFKKRSGEQFALGQKQAAALTFEFAEEMARLIPEYQATLKRNYPEATKP